MLTQKFTIASLFGVRYHDRIFVIDHLKIRIKGIVVDIDRHNRSLSPGLFVDGPDIRTWLVSLIGIPAHIQRRFQTICDLRIDVGAEIPAIIVETLAFVSAHLIHMAQVEEIINFLAATVDGKIVLVLW
ncbi:hypothetical protein D3C81_1676770 [compost metagenome]